MNTKLAYSVSAAAEAADSGRTKLYEAIKRGDLVARKHGTRTIILAEDLQAWLAALPKLETGDKDSVADHFGLQDGLQSGGAAGPRDPGEADPARGGRTCAGRTPKRGPTEASGR